MRGAITLRTVRAYRLAFATGEAARETGAFYSIDHATAAAETVIENGAASWGIDATEESFIRMAACEGYTHGYHGYEPMSNASIAIHFD